jgi:hypothetical protein
MAHLPIDTNGSTCRCYITSSVGELRRQNTGHSSLQGSPELSTYTTPRRDGVPTEHAFQTARTLCSVPDTGLIQQAWSVITFLVIKTPGEITIASQPSGATGSARFSNVLGNTQEGSKGRRDATRMIIREGIMLPAAPPQYKIIPCYAN